MAWVSVARRSCSFRRRTASPSGHPCEGAAPARGLSSLPLVAERGRYPGANRAVPPLSRLAMTMTRYQAALMCMTVILPCISVYTCGLARAATGDQTARLRRCRPLGSRPDGPCSVCGPLSTRCRGCCGASSGCRSPDAVLGREKPSRAGWRDDHAVRRVPGEPRNAGGRLPPGPQPPPAQSSLDV